MSVLQPFSSASRAQFGIHTGGLHGLDPPLCGEMQGKVSPDGAQTPDVCFRRRQHHATWDTSTTMYPDLNCLDALI